MIKDSLDETDFHGSSARISWDTLAFTLDLAGTVHTYVKYNGRGG